MELQLIDISRDNKADVPKRTDAVRDRSTNAVRGRSTGAVRHGNKYKRKRRAAARTRYRYLSVILLWIGGILFCLLLYQIIRSFAGFGIFADVFSQESQVVWRNTVARPELVEDYLTVNPNSRPGYMLKKVNNIFVHYTANPGTSAAQNRSYFENLAITNETSASAHFIIGYEGEIIQCLPLEEIGYAVKKRNQDSISIECCYLQEDGAFTDETYESLVQLCAWLLNEYNLAPDAILRHYDEGGKKCPLYYVEHEDAWLRFLGDVEQYILDKQ